jgi:carboxyvinyl-carboxyphosphonate phosphorylmutase
VHETLGKTFIGGSVDGRARHTERVADLLRHADSGPARFRQLLAEPGPVLLPGCYDALGARLIEQAGFDAAYMTGFGTAASLLGRPDVGLLTATEMLDNLRRIVAATDLPVIADADTGYGNPINVIRTVQDYERTGAAGMHIEDQVMPKRCGHMEGKQVIDAGEFVAKIEAAVAARANPDFAIIARTDARAPLGLEAALARARAVHAAGADVLFVEALQGEDEIEVVAKELAGIPLLFNWAEGGKTPPLTLDRMTSLGFAMVIMPISTLLAATTAMQRVLASIKEHGTPIAVLSDVPTFGEFTDLIGLPEITGLEQRFGR